MNEINLDMINWTEYRRKHPVIQAVKVPFDCTINMQGEIRDFKRNQYIVRVDPDGYFICPDDIFVAVYEKLPFHPTD